MSNCARLFHCLGWSRGRAADTAWVCLRWKARRRPHRDETPKDGLRSGGARCTPTCCAPTHLLTPRQQGSFQSWGKDPLWERVSMCAHTYLCTHTYVESQAALQAICMHSLEEEDPRVRTGSHNGLVPSGWHESKTHYFSRTEREVKECQCVVSNHKNRPRKNEQTCFERLKSYHRQYKVFLDKD